MGRTYHEHSNITQHSKKYRRGLSATAAKFHHKFLHMFLVLQLMGGLLLRRKHLWISDAKIKQHEDSHWMWEAKLLVPFPVIMKNASHTPKVNIPSEMINPKPTNLFWKWSSWICMKLILLNFDNLPVSSSYFPGSLLLAALKVHGHLECIRVIPIALSFKRFWARALANFIFQWKSTLPRIQNWKHSQNQAYLFQYIIFLNRVLPNKRIVQIFRL